MLAASAASARPLPNTSTKCPAVPAPPLAITGICTALLTIAVSSQSKPPRIPSVSIEVSKISPAPRDSASRAQSKTRRPVAFRPPLTKTSASSTPASSTRRASIATITACAPKLPPISPINSGRAIADELILTLSAPASNTAAASSALRIPPPTVNGTNSAAAARFTVSNKVPRPSCVAVISNSTISSAPAAAWRCANSAGSPASTISTNCTPFTTRPLRTSRQAIIRFVSIGYPNLIGTAAGTATDSPSHTIRASVSPFSITAPCSTNHSTSKP